MGRLTPAQVKSGLKDRNSLVQFLNTVLGYRTSLVAYENPAEELHIPPYLCNRINGWWLISDYPGILPFRIYFVQLNQYQFTFNTCASIIKWFHNRYPGYYLFVFTKDYVYLVFMAIEWSMERRPAADSQTWPFEPKPYPRLLFINRRNPNDNDLLILSTMSIQQSAIEPDVLHNRIIHAMKKVERWEPIPEWFLPLPYRYRVRDSAQYFEAITDIGSLLTQAANSLLGCLASHSLSELEAVYEYIESVIDLKEVDELLEIEDMQRLQYCLKRLGDAQEAYEDDVEEAMLCIQDALIGINEVQDTLVAGAEALNKMMGDDYGSSGYY